MPQLVWLITGCSTGLGEALAYAALARGEKVIATARAPINRLHELEKAGATTLELDVSTDRASIHSVIEKAHAVYGRIDVVVPNAAKSTVCYLEEFTEEMWTKEFATNFFGVINVVNAVLPIFRRQRSGVVAFMSSLWGHVAFPLNGPYAASKHAVEGYAKTLALEVADFNIRTVLFGLGFFRTDIITNGSVIPPSLEDYGPKFAVIGELASSLPGTQPGDPSRCVERIIDVVKSEGLAAGKEIPPFVGLGSDGYLTIRKRGERMIQICDEWEELSKSTDFPGPKTGFFATTEHYA